MRRRDLLQYIGATGALSTLGLIGGRSAHAATDRYLLVVWTKGGWDPSFVFDPHFDSTLLEGDPTAQPGAVGDLRFADAATRPSVRAFFEEHGQRTAIINGISVGSISHLLCTRIMLTGSRQDSASDLGTLLAAETGGSLAMPHLIVNGPRFPGGLGAHAVPLSSTLTGTALGTLPVGGNFDPDQEARAAAWLAEEARILSASDPHAALLADASAVGLERMALLRESADNLDLPADPTATERRNAALEALSGGLSRAVIFEGVLPDRFLWDSHQNNDLSQDTCFETAFDELRTLMAELQAAPAPGGGSLADRTTVLVLSEMGRTPIHNASDGKDHWPYTSAMLVGAGVSGGRVYGATDEFLVGQPVDPSTGDAHDSGSVLTPAHLISGVLSSFDVDPSPWFADVRPFTAPFS